MTRTTALLDGLAHAAYVRVGDDVLTSDDLAAAVGGLAARLQGLHRVAVWATPSMDTCVAVAATLVTGAAAIPLDPHAAPAELAHVVNDSHPQLVLAASHAVIPP